MDPKNATTSSKEDDQKSAAKKTTDSKSVSATDNKSRESLNKKVKNFQK